MKDIIFDLDGTLIDSSECIFGIYRALFGELGIPVPSDDVLRTYIGPPVEYVIKDYLPEEQRASACERFRELYKKIDLKKANVLFEGTAEMLEKIQKSGKRLFVGSTKNEKTANLVCELLGIKKYFTAIYGSRFEIGRLTKQQVLEAIINDFGIDKTDAVLIGDTHFDAEGAQSEGIAVDIVKFGFGDEKKLANFDIKNYFETSSDVAEYYSRR